jgi:hypothetical protein
MQALGASVATSTLLTRRVTLRVVPFWIERLIAPAGTVPGSSDDEGSAETVGGATGSVGGVRKGPGAAHPASRAESRATASDFIIRETVHGPGRLRRGLVRSPHSAPDRRGD